MRDRDKLFVRKINNVSRNYERLIELGNTLPVPNVYFYDGRMLDMEYIHGLDMKSYLENHSIEPLISFLSESLQKLSKKSVDKDYTPIYNEMIGWIEDGIFPFRKEQLIEKLPKVLPQSVYHGDMTLENIIYDVAEKRFVFIDPVTVKYDSYIFDIAKMRQDLECKWFLRKTRSLLDSKIFSIQEKITQLYPESKNDYLLILMLLRVFLHSKKGTIEYDFIMREVNRLWK